MEDLLQQIEKEDNFRGSLSCCICKLWLQNNLSDIAKLRSLLRRQQSQPQPQQHSDRSEFLDIITGSANDWEVLIYVLPQAIDCSLSSGDEDTLLGILHLP